MILKRREEPIVIEQDNWFQFAMQRNFMVLGLVLALTTILGADAMQSINNMPVVGILSMPITECDSISADQREVLSSFSPPSGTTSCFTSFYAQWLLASGVRSAVIPYDATPEELSALLSSVNGVLFTGGDLYLSPNNQSDYYKVCFPVESFQQWS